MRHLLEEADIIMSRDLRTPNEMLRQKAIEAIPESERSEEEDRDLATYRRTSNYWPTPVGDR